VARVASLCESSGDSFLGKTEFDIDPKVKKYLQAYRFNDALNYIWEQINSANKKINESKLWEQKGDTLKEGLQSLVYAVQEIAFHLQPFMPETAEKILEQFKGPKIKSEKSLFPRL